MLGASSSRGAGTALVLGAGGFIGGHLVRRLKFEGYRVRGVDLRLSDNGGKAADEFIVGDLRNVSFCRGVFNFNFDEVYQLAADMGGAGYLFTGDHDAEILHNSAMINLNVLEAFRRQPHGRIFFASSACVYPEHNQQDLYAPNCAEDSVYPAAPDSEYGWEKLFSERLYLAYARNHGVEVRIGRYHNIFGPEGAWEGGREKVPAAVCRKVAMATAGGAIEIWGDGNQTRSFLFIDDCIDATTLLMRSHFDSALNIGSEQMVTINDLVDIVCDIAGKKLRRCHVLERPTGVRARNSDNRVIRQELGWEPRRTLRLGLERTYEWINRQIILNRRSCAVS